MSRRSYLRLYVIFPMKELKLYRMQHFWKRSVHTPQTTTNFKMKTQAASASSLLHQLGKSCKVCYFSILRRKGNCVVFSTAEEQTVVCLCLFGVGVRGAVLCLLRKYRRVWKASVFLRIFTWIWEKVNYFWMTHHWAQIVTEECLGKTTPWNSVLMPLWK